MPGEISVSFLSFEDTETEKTGVFQKGQLLVFGITAVRLLTVTRKRRFGSLCVPPIFGRKPGDWLELYVFSRPHPPLHDGGEGSHFAHIGRPCLHSMLIPQKDGSDSAAVARALATEQASRACLFVERRSEGMSALRFR